MANNQKKRNQYIKKVATTVFVSLAALVISIVVWLFNLLKLIDMHKFIFCTVLRSTHSLEPGFFVNANSSLLRAAWNIVSEGNYIMIKVASR